MDTALETTNIDKNISPAFYRGREQLLIRSMFNTIQGEMPFAGYPATFLRLGGCNRGAKTGMGCQGCDTDFHVDKSEWWDIDLIAAKIFSMLMDGRTHPRLLVITGGEPLMQNIGLLKFFDKLNELATQKNLIRVQFETNGDFAPVISRHYNLEKVYVVSPKSPFKKKPWWMLDNDGVNYVFRRVVSGDPQSNYYEVPEEILFMKREFNIPVYLSPQTHYLPGATQAEGESRHAINWELTDLAIQRAIELADKHDMIVSAQWHAYANIR